MKARDERVALMNEVCLSFPPDFSLFRVSNFVLSSLVVMQVLGGIRMLKVSRFINFCLIIPSR
jgi:hypothetical protein